MHYGRSASGEFSEFNFAPTWGYLNPALTTWPWKQLLCTILEDKQGVLVYYGNVNMVN